MTSKNETATSRDCATCGCAKSWHTVTISGFDRVGKCHRHQNIWEKRSGRAAECPKGKCAGFKSAAVA